MTRYNADFLSRATLESFGFKNLGTNVLIHSTAVLVNCSHISIGSNVRIDAFTIISAGDEIKIGNYVHIAAHCILVGQAAIRLHDFSNVSHATRILSASDDFSGEWLLGPTVPNEFRNVRTEPVEICRHVIIGVGCVVLPGATLCEGVAVGALSLVNNRLDPWGIYVGTPSRRVKERSQNILEKAAIFLGTTHDK